MNGYLSFLVTMKVKFLLVLCLALALILHDSDAWRFRRAVRRITKPVCRLACSYYGCRWVRIHGRLHRRCRKRCHRICGKRDEPEIPQQDDPFQVRNKALVFLVYIVVEGVRNGNGEERQERSFNCKKCTPPPKK